MNIFSSDSIIIVSTLFRGGAMAAQSRIEWTESTWNPLTGCTEISPGCKHCYAERMAKRLQAMGRQIMSMASS